MKYLFLLLSAFLCMTAGYMLYPYFNPVDMQYETQTRLVTHYDTIIRSVTVPNMIIYRDIPSEVDTAEILRDYFASIVYEDTIVDNDKANMVIKETISENRILERDVRLITINKLVTRTPRSTLLLGASAGIDPSIHLTWMNGKWGFSGGFAFTSKTPVFSVHHKIYQW